MPRLKTRRSSSSGTPCSAQPAEDGGPLPGTRVDHRAEPLRAARARGSRRSRRPSRARAPRTSARARKRPDVVEVADASAAAAGRRRTAPSPTMRRTSEKPFAWIPADGKPITTSPGGDARAVDQVGAVDQPDDRAAEVDLLLAVDPGQLRRLAAEDGAARGAADLRCALDELGDLLGVDRVGGDVVEEEERLGTRREHVVDAVRGEVHPAPAQLSRPDDRARASSRPSRSRRRAAGRSSSAKRPAKTPKEPSTAGVRVAVDGAAEPVDDRVGRGERDTGRGVGLGSSELTGREYRTRWAVRPSRTSPSTRRAPRSLARLLDRQRVRASVPGARRARTGFSPVVDSTRRVLALKHALARRPTLHPLEREVVRARWRRSARASPRPCGGRRRAALVGHVDPVEARRDDRRRGDPDVHLLGARRRTASAISCRIVLPRTIESSTITMPLSGDLVERVELEPDPLPAELLVGLDERPADVAVLDQPLVVRDARALGEADRSRRAGVGDRHHDVGVGRAPPRRAARPSARAPSAPRCRRGGSRAGRSRRARRCRRACRPAGTRLRRVEAVVVDPRRPRRGARRAPASAPTRSSAHDSEATTQSSPIRPSVSGRMPCGSRKATSASPTIATTE